MSFFEFLFGLRLSTKLRHPEIYARHTNDPWNRLRTTPMEVLAVGMPRTGTATMQSALRVLGYETYHGFRAFVDIEDHDLWNAAYRTKYLDEPSPSCRHVDRDFFDQVLGHMNAVTDAPASSFARELIEAYPEAKIVLVERDFDSWYRSFESVFVSTYKSKIFRLVAALDPGKVGRMRRFIAENVAKCEFDAGDGTAFQQNAQKVYKRHYGQIRELLERRGEAETRLLEFELARGWEPLCQFLGKEVPNGIPFPRVNETQLIQEKVRVMLIHSIHSWIASNLGFIGGVSGFIIVAIALQAMTWPR